MLFFCYKYSLERISTAARVLKATFDLFVFSLVEMRSSIEMNWKLLALTNAHTELTSDFFKFGQIRKGQKRR